jgi:hypothetical protein
LPGIILSFDTVFVLEYNRMSRILKPPRRE